MTQNSKRITFKANPLGITWMFVDMTSWQITSTCPQAHFLSQRAFRLTKRGTRLEYRNGSSYSELPADIESIE